VSKAFTKEDDGSDPLEGMRPVENWPSGIKNYLTPAGFAALKREIDELRASMPADPRRKLQVERQLSALLTRLEAAEVVEPSTQPADVVRFGATVTVEDEHGQERRYRIVGVDEADPSRALVSWRSPIAGALMGCRVGDLTTLRTPRGNEDLTIVAIEYAA
jgi:transcription elongation factor GreB